MDSMTDDDASLPIDFNVTTQVPRTMEGTTSMNESAGPGKFSEVHTLKEHEMHISELKKENFELKLRIYFLEEKLQLSQRNVDDDDAFKMNIELKVEIEKLKSELNEKRRLLLKASTAVESMDRNSQDQMKQLRDQCNADLEQVKKSYETKLQENEESLKVANAQLEKLKNKLNEIERMNAQLKEETRLTKDGPSAVEAIDMQAKLQAKLREKDRIIDELKSAVDVRESRIKSLSQADNAVETADLQTKGLRQKIEERDREIMKLNEKLRKSEAVIKELSSSRVENERKIELISKEAISTTQKLNEKLRSKQTELDEVQEKFRVLQQNLEKAQDIIDEASLKDVEAFEERSKALKVKDALIADLQGNLKQKEVENDHLTRSMARKDKELEKMNETKSKQEETTRQVYEKEKQLTAITEQLTSVKARLRETIDEHDEEIQKMNIELENQLNSKDQIIRRVTETLEDKESIIQDLIVTQENLSLSNSRDDITDTKEELIEKLRNRLKERDAVVEANIEDKFLALHKKEEEIQELRKGLRERDRLIENINATVLSNEDVIKNLQTAVDEKTALVNDLKAKQEIQQKQFKEANEIALKRVRENEGLVEKLKRNLTNREQQIENLKNVVLHRGATEAKDDQETKLLNGLTATLHEKEKLVAELLAERSAMIASSEVNNEKMMSSLAEKEDLLKEMCDKMNQLSSEKNSTIARLEQRINNLSLDVQAVENSKMWTQQENDIRLGKLKQSLVEKDRTIEKLINSGKEKDKVFLKLQEVTSNRATSPVKLENVEYTAELKRDLQQKDSLLKQAAETIEDLQAKLKYMPGGEELKKSLEQTEKALHESEIQRKKDHSESVSTQEKHLEKIQALENEISSLKEENESWKLQQENFKSENGSKDQVIRLEELLLQQIQETNRLSDILKKERLAYEDATKLAKPGSYKLQGELEDISELRHSLEEGIKQNNKLRVQLQEKFYQSGNPAQQEDVRRLNAKHEESERWNISLQSRLDALQPRIRGVGESSGTLLASSSASPTRRNDQLNQTSFDSTGLSSSGDVSRLQNQLAEKSKVIESLNKQLDYEKQRKANQTSFNSTASPSDVKYDKLQKESAEKSRTIHTLKEKLRTFEANTTSHTSVSSFKEDFSGKQAQNASRIVEFEKVVAEKQKIIDSLKENLRKSSNAKNNFVAVNGNVDGAGLSSTSKVEQLQNELVESQRVIHELRDKLALSKLNKQGQISFENRSGSSPVDLIDGSKTAGSSQTFDDSRRSSQVNQLRKELENVYEKNDELRKTVAENVNFNRQLNKDLTASEQKSGVFEIELQNYVTKLKEMNARVESLSNELAKARQVNSDYQSQLKTLRPLQEQATRFREEAVNASTMNEKLNTEVQRLSSSLESVGKENERLKQALSTSKSHGHPPVVNSSPTSKSELQSPRGTPTRELQTLQEKLNLSERLNTALKYELEASKRIALKSSPSKEPLLGHVEELRELRARLEESIKTYNDLCLQLEEKLKDLDKSEGTEEAVFRESISQARENESLRLELAKLKEEAKLIQQQLEDHRLTRKRDKEKITALNNQLTAMNKTNESLRNDLAICDSVIKLSQQPNSQGSNSSSAGPGDNSDAIMLLLTEIRSLRQQLEASIQSNNSLREILQKQLASSSPQRSIDTRSTELPVRTSPSVSPGKDGSLTLGCQSLPELRKFINTSFEYTESLLVKIMRITLEEYETNDKLVEIKKEMESLRSLLFKCVKLLDHLWAEQLSSSPSTTHQLTRQNDELRNEITLLKKRVLSQSKILENTATRLESSSRMRKEVERSLFARLSETRDTVGSSRRQLEDRLSSRNSS